MTFNLVNQTSSFNSIFETKPLEPNESTQIERMLVDSYVPGSIAEDQVQEDVRDLKRLTSEIKAIGKQSVVLIGERVFKAREMLKPYRDGTFTKWLDEAFGARRTGYNALSYYELYRVLPDDLKQYLRQLQHKTAYLLASKPGDVELKAEIIKECQGKSHSESMQLIQEKFPTSKEDKRTKKGSIDKILAKLEDVINELFENKDKIEKKHELFLEKMSHSLSILH